jgi:peptidoglycan/xylan/chitin deacetylase (PgdA/CDA1 family)
MTDGRETGKAAALLYHELRPEASAYSYVLPTARFAEHLALFARLGAESYQPVITFDDGHVSNYTQALPLLDRHGVEAHFFITAGWTGERAGFMTSAEIRALRAAGHTIGAHGWSHTLLTQCSPAELQHELVDAKQRLEDTLGEPVTSLSLPGGRANAGVCQAVRAAGYTTVWTSVPGATALPLRDRVGRYNIRAGVTDETLRQLLDPSSGALARAGRVQGWKARAQALLGDRLYARLWSVVNRSEGSGDQP